MANAFVVGFTGSHHGLAKPQADASFVWLVDNAHRIREVHHGDCVGGDAWFHYACRVLSISPIIGHPPTNPRLRAFCQFDTLMAPKPYLVRNLDIATVATVLVACPESGHEVVRSGVWATVRYARKLRRPLVKIWPDGRLEVESPEVQEAAR